MQRTQKLTLEDNTWELKVELKENPGKELEILENFADTTDRTQLIPIAESKYASIELLDKLSESNDLGVVLTVVRNQNTSAETLERVFTSHLYPDYFFNDLASNPNTPIVILEDIYKQKHKNSGIAQNLVKNPVTPKTILEKLSSETEVRVFHAFVKRLDSKCDFLDKMKERINSKQKTYGVYKYAMSDYERKCIKKKLTEGQRLLKKKHEIEKKVKDALLVSKGTESITLEKMAKEAQDLDLLEHIASNEYASKKLLTKLSKSDQIGLQSFVAANPNTPVPILRNFYKQYSNHAHFLYALVGNRSTPEFILKEIYSGDKTKKYHQRFGYNSNTPSSILRDIYTRNSKNIDILRALTENPNTPMDVVDKLSNESDIIIFERFVKRIDVHCKDISRMKKNVSLQNKKTTIYKDSERWYKRKCING